MKTDSNSFAVVNDSLLLSFEECRIVVYGVCNRVVDTAVLNDEDI